MQTVHAYIRTTYGYNSGWRHLDKEEFVATVKMTPAVQREEPLDYDDGGTYVQYARAPSGVSLDLLKQALRDTMGGSNCRHEHDCCGCASRNVSVKHVGNRRLVIHTRVSFNY